MQLFLFTVSIPPGTHISPKCIIIYNARNIGVFCSFSRRGLYVAVKNKNYNKYLYNARFAACIINKD